MGKEPNAYCFLYSFEVNIDSAGGGGGGGGGQSHLVGGGGVGSDYIRWFRQLPVLQTYQKSRFSVRKVKNCLNVIYHIRNSFHFTFEID